MIGHQSYWTRSKSIPCQVLLVFLMTTGFYLLLQFFASPEPLILPTYGLLEKTSSKSSYAIATFLAGSDNITLATEYFTSLRVLTYQLLHNNDTRCSRDISFLIVVTSKVPEDQRHRLAQDGAQIVEVEDVPLQWWTKTRVSLWKDQFTKLRILEMTQYDRILYVDADTFLTRPIDGIFDEPMVQIPAQTKFDRISKIRGDEAPLPANYMFAARSDNGRAGKRDHPFPPNKTPRFNAGFWVVAPSKELFQYLMSVMNHLLRFNPHEMEQSLLNYALRTEGAMPWTELDYRWNGNYVNMEDYKGGVAALHDKLWKDGPEELRRLWRICKDKMERYHAPETTNFLSQAES